VNDADELVTTDWLRAAGTTEHTYTRIGKTLLIHPACGGTAWHLNITRAACYPKRLTRGQVLRLAAALDDVLSEETK
jgi:hypothetical protein